MNDEGRSAGAVPNSVCARCGAAFTCGMKAGAQTCWCARLPALPTPPDPAGRCYCPRCLEALLAAAAAESGSP